jgi:hypothetical protein
VLQQRAECHDDNPTFANELVLGACSFSLNKKASVYRLLLNSHEMKNQSYVLLTICTGALAALEL